MRLMFFLVTTKSEKPTVLGSLSFLSLFPLPFNYFTFVYSKAKRGTHVAEHVIC